MNRFELWDKVARNSQCRFEFGDCSSWPVAAAAAVGRSDLLNEFHDTDG